MINIYLDRMMYILSWIVLGRLVIYVHSAHFVSENCSYNSCLLLYRRNDTQHAGDYYTFTQSSDFCKDHRMELAAIPDHVTQTRVTDWLRNLSLDQSVWVAGKKSTSGTWKTVAGIIENNIPGSGNCVHVFIANANSAYTPSKEGSCQDIHATVCQLQGKCNNPSPKNISYTGRCYVVPVKQHLRSWYDAQSFCYVTYGGDVIYDVDVLDNTTIMWQIQLAVGTSVRFWLGVSRYIWQWESGLSSSPVPMQYFTFSTTPSDTTVSMCIILELRVWKWRSVPCNDQLQYWMCTNGSTTTTTTTKTTTTTTTTTTAVDISPVTAVTSQSWESFTFTTSSGGNKSTSLGVDRDGNQNLTMIIASAVAAIVVLVVVIVVIVVLVKRKKLKKSLHEDATRESRTHRGVGDGEEEGAFDPNVVYAMPQKNKKPSDAKIDHKVGPEGDLYALSMKRVPKK